MLLPPERRLTAWLSPQVIKVGTSSLLRSEQNTLNLSNLARICETVKTLHSQGECLARGAAGHQPRCRRG